MPSSVGAPVPLSSVARIEERSMPLVVNHVGQLFAATISFNTAPGVSLGNAVAAIERKKAAVQPGAVPLSVETSFQGAALAFRASLSEHAAADPGGGGHHVHRAGRAVREHGASGHDLIHTALGRWGHLLALMAARLDLDIIAIIGIVLLIGIVKKNAIMTIDFALEAQRDEGLSARCDLSGVSVAVPAHLDDDAGGFAGGACR